MEMGSQSFRYRKGVVAGLEPVRFVAGEASDVKELAARDPMCVCVGRGVGEGERVRMRGRVSVRVRVRARVRG